jgi:hypothetical protein
MFGSKIRGLVEHLVQHANNTPFDVNSGQDALMSLQIRNKLRASKAEKLGELFQRVIPTSTKAILGNPGLCEDHLLFLPHIGLQLSLSSTMGTRLITAGLMFIF